MQLTAERDAAGAIRARVGGGVVPVASGLLRV
jgi:hypothetical protein